MMSRSSKRARQRRRRAKQRQATAKSAGVPHAQPARAGGTRRSSGVGFSTAGVLAAAFLGLAGVGAASAIGGGDDYDRYCVDARTDTRVTDERCDREGGYYNWYYLNRGSRAPGVGEHMSGGSYTVPSRGGFGGTGGGGGG
jgi:hypothetical protein